MAGGKDEAQDKSPGNSQREQGAEPAAAESAMEETCQTKSPVPIKTGILSRGTSAKTHINAPGRDTSLVAELI